MKNVEQVKQAMREISSCYQDSRESGKCAVPEDVLKRWHQTLSETLLKVDAVDDTPLIQRLRNEVMMSKATHNFTFSRDELIELLGGKFYVLANATLAKPSIARDSTVENTDESAEKEPEVQSQDWMLKELFERQQAGFEECYKALGIDDDRERSWSALVLALQEKTEDAALFRALVSHASEFKTSFDKESQPTMIKAVFKITTNTGYSMRNDIRTLVKDFGKNADALDEGR